MKITLTSGAELDVALAPFKDAHDLQRAMAAELKEIKIASDMDITSVDFMKNIICSAISSDKIMNCLNVCMKRCTYNNLKITNDTFEPEEARGDYLQCCVEVAKANLLPFLKGLTAQFKDITQAKKT